MAADKKATSELLLQKQKQAAQNFIDNNHNYRETGLSEIDKKEGLDLSNNPNFKAAPNPSHYIMASTTNNFLNDPNKCSFGSCHPLFKSPLQVIWFKSGGGDWHAYNRAAAYTLICPLPELQELTRLIIPGLFENGYADPNEKLWHGLQQGETVPHIRPIIMPICFKDDAELLNDIIIRGGDINQCVVLENFETGINTVDHCPPVIFAIQKEALNCVERLLQEPKLQVNCAIRTGKTIKWEKKEGGEEVSTEVFTETKRDILTVFDAQYREFQERERSAPGIDYEAKNKKWIELRSRLQARLAVSHGHDTTPQKTVDAKRSKEQETAPTLMTTNGNLKAKQ